MRFTRLKYAFICGLFLLASNSHAYSFAKTSLEANYESYFSANQAYFGGDNTESEFSTAGLKLDYFNKRGQRENKLDLTAFYSFTEEYPFINPTEAYTNRHGSRVDTAFGRKLEEWSRADEFWQTGLWQPRFNWDKMDPQSVGLTGLFFKGTRRDETKWIGFISPIYIPEQGPRFYSEDGFVTSKSPWFISPPHEAIIGEQQTPLIYTIDRPQTADVVFRPSIGFRVENEVSDNDNVGFAYAYKPINQMLLSYDYRLRLLDNSQEAPVKVTPVFPYHHILTSDWHRKMNGWNFDTSATYERPEKMPDDERIVSQQIGDQIIASLMMSYDLVGEGPSATTVYGGIIKSWGAVKPDSGDTISEISQFEIRQRWLQAYRLGLNYPIWTKWRRLHNKVELTYDSVQNASMFSTALEYNVASQWILTGSFDMLAVYDSDRNQYDKAFIRQFRANDRVAMGFNYVY